MTALFGGGMREAGKKAGAWLYGMVFQTGWRRWTLLAAIAMIFVVILALFLGGIDYRKDPSALVPRSVFFYAETRSLATSLRDAGAWPIWDRGRLPDIDGQANPFPREFALLVGAGISGMGLNLPLAWIVGSRKAAVCFVPADDTAGESWAAFFDYPDPAGALAALRIEPGFSLTPVPGQGNIFELSGENGGKLYFLHLAPWFIVSSDVKLPRFAVDSMGRPAFSLARTGLVPSWSRGLAIRGMIDPSYILTEPSGGLRSALAITVAGWLTRDARLGFSSGFSSEGLVKAQAEAGVISNVIRGGGLWPLFKFLLGLLGIILVALAAVIILAMLGWAGWLKILALKAGIVPAAAPAQTIPSDAFKEDSGVPSPAKAGAAGVPAAISDFTEPPACENGTPVKVVDDNKNDGVSGS